MDGREEMTDPRPDDAPVTWGELRRVVRKLRKEFDERLGEAFEAISSGDQTQSEFWDEHEDKIARNHRALRRLAREFAEFRDSFDEDN